LSDSAVSLILEIDRDRETALIELERLELVEGELLRRLDDLKTRARRAMWDHFRDRRHAAFGDYIEAARRAHDAYIAVVAITSEAQSAGFVTEASHWPMLPTPHVLTPETLLIAEKAHDREGDLIADRQPPEARRQAEAATPKAAPKAIAAPKPPPTAQAAQKRRPPRVDAVEPGKVRVTIIRNGVELADGFRAAAGDVIAMTEADAFSLMRGGAVDLAPDEEEAAANAH
jgi:hypothetical protein